MPCLEESRYGFSYKQANLPVYSNLNQIQRSAAPIRRSDPLSSGHPQEPFKRIVADLAIASPRPLKATQHLPYSEQSGTRTISPDTKGNGSRSRDHDRSQPLPRTPARRRGSQGIGMTDSRHRQPARNKAPHAFPKDPSVLAAPRKRAMPEPPHVEPKDPRRVASERKNA
jgi:hypothetical protein